MMEKRYDQLMAVNTASKKPSINSKKKRGKKKLSDEYLGERNSLG